MNKKIIADFNWKDFDEIHQSIFSEDLFYHGNFEQIAKLFLSKAISIDVYAAEFEDIYKTTVTESTNSQLPRNESEFYKLICETYLWLNEEPRSHFVQLYSGAQIHLDQIDQSIVKIQKDLTAIKNAKQKRSFSMGEVDREAVLEYYFDINHEAKKEILLFLRKGLKSTARIKSMVKTRGFNIFLEIPYSYAWEGGVNYYSIKFPTDIANKFLEESPGEIEQIKRLYAEDRFEFNKFLKEYIDREEIIFLIAERLKSHHSLNKRQSQLLELLSLYEKGNLSTFLNAAVSHIEGILTDCCILFERDKERIRELEYSISTKGLRWKLSHLRDKFGWGEFHFEYYNFRFRVLRNKVAHGQLDKIDEQLISAILLLDILDVCNLTHSLNILLNRKVNTIKIIENDLKKERVDYLFVLCYVLLCDIDVPAYYQLNKQVIDIEALKERPAFWEYLSDARHLIDQNMRFAIANALINLRADPKFRSQAEAGLKKIANKSRSKFDRLAFFASIR
jgi:hypothetical protein